MSVRSKPPELPKPDASAEELRMQHAGELVALLGAGRWLVVPNRRSPRLLVPAAPTRAAGHAVLRHGVHPGPRQRLQRAALAAALRSRAGTRSFPSVSGDAESDGLLTHLAELLGRPLLAAAVLSAPRANRKPVLHLMDAAGTTVGYAKVGVNRLTNELVHHEAAVLRRLAGQQHPAFDVPAVVHQETWRGHEVLVTSAVPVHRGREPRVADLDPAMQQLARSAPARRAAGDYCAALMERSRAAACSPRQAAVRETVLDLLAEAAARPEAAELLTGLWHGDWTAWNCALVDGRVVVWDWERCAEPVPHGFDAVHYRVQAGLQRQPASAWTELAAQSVEQSPHWLAAWGVSPAAARLTATLYLIDLALRYLLDDQAAAGGRGGDVTAWLVPALQRVSHRER